MDDALVRQGAVGIGKRHLPAAQKVSLGPRLAIGRRTGTNAVQDGDEAVGVQARRERGRFLDGRGAGE